jgi:hypothetical protein
MMTFVALCKFWTERGRPNDIDNWHAIPGHQFEYSSIAKFLFLAQPSAVHDNCTAFQFEVGRPGILVTSEMMKEDKVASRKAFLIKDKLYVNL